MGTLLKGLGIALVIGGLLLWAVSVLPPLPTIFVVKGDRTFQVASPLPASEDGAAVLTGTLIYDRQTPPVPFILYALPDGEKRTKQLVFRDEGCATSAGDLPCPNGRVISPNLPEGTSIRVTGVITGDQILVTDLSERNNVGVY